MRAASLTSIACSRNGAELATARPRTNRMRTMQRIGREWDVTSRRGPPASCAWKPRGQLTQRDAENVAKLSSSAPGFATMRKLAMRFRGILKGRNPDKLDAWLEDAHQSGLYGLRRFVHVIRQDLEAVRNAIVLRWSNGQTEGQINRLKALQRSMYGQAGAELLRARLIPMCDLEQPSL